MKARAHGTGEPTGGTHDFDRQDRLCPVAWRHCGIDRARALGTRPAGRGAVGLSRAQHHPDRALSRWRWHRHHGAAARERPGGRAGQARHRGEPGGWWGLARLGGAGGRQARRLHHRLSQRPEPLCRLSRSQDRPQGIPRQLHATHKPRARLQHLGGEGRQPLQDRGRCDRRRKAGAGKDHRYGVRCWW